MKKFYIILVALFMVNGAIAQWVPQNSGTTKNLYSVYFTDENTGYAVGDSGTILNTQDGGINWTVQNSGTSNDLFSVFFTSPNTGYAVGHNQVFSGGIILKTLNGGLEWRSINTDSKINYCDVHFPNSDTGYAVGFINTIIVPTGVIMKTIDGGETWYGSGSVSTPYCVFFTNAITGYVLGGGRNSGQRIYKTTDGGINWTEPSSFYGNSIHFPSIDTGYLACYDDILKTNNGGLNWEVVYNYYGSLYSCYDVHFTNTEVGYVVGNGGIILKTENGGSNWTTQESGNYDELFSVYFPTINTGYVVGNYGTILKTTNGGYPVEINGHPSNGHTLKIYPNPSSTQITLKTLNKCSLSILSINGQQLLTHQLTEPKTQIDISNLPSGVYFVRVTGERTVQVGKFVKQ